MAAYNGAIVLDEDLAACGRNPNLLATLGNEAI